MSLIGKVKDNKGITVVDEDGWILDKRKVSGVPLLCQTLNVPYKDKRTYLKTTLAYTALTFDGLYGWKRDNSNLIYFDRGYNESNIPIVNSIQRGFSFTDELIFTNSDNSLIVVQRDDLSVSQTTAFPYSFSNIISDGAYYYGLRSGGITKLTTSGVDVQTFVSASYSSICFDGEHIWAASNSGYVVKINTSGSFVQTISVAITVAANSSFLDMVFDGNNLWLPYYWRGSFVVPGPIALPTNFHTLYKINLNTSTSQLISALAHSESTHTDNYVCFDGEYIWWSSQNGYVGIEDPRTDLFVKRINTVSNSVVFTIQEYVGALKFDGQDIWCGTTVINTNTDSLRIIPKE